MEWSAQAYGDTVGFSNPLGPTVGEPRQSIFSATDPRNAPTTFTFPAGTERVDVFRTTVNTSAGMAQVPLDNFILVSTGDLLASLPDITTGATGLEGWKVQTSGGGEVYAVCADILPLHVPGSLDFP